MDSDRLRPILGPPARRRSTPASKIATRFYRTGVLTLTPHPATKKEATRASFFIAGGEGGIRTPGTVSPYTRFPGEHLKPLSHLSDSFQLRRYARRKIQARRSFGALGARIRLRHRHLEIRFGRVQIVRRLQSVVFDRLLISLRLVAGQVTISAAGSQTRQDAERDRNQQCPAHADSHQAGISTPAPDIADSICS